MANTEQDVWVFRIVHQDTGKPAQGVPVTVLDKTGNPAGYWVSEADGTVTIPRRDVAKLRLRVGLRNEEPIELLTASLGEGPIDLAAPTWLPQAPSGASERGPREPGPTATPRPAEPHDVPGHVLYFQRLVMFAEGAPVAKHGPRDAVADFFALASDRAAPSAPRRRRRESRSALAGGDPDGAQHQPGPGRHLPLLRAARALQGRGADSARAPGDLRPVPPAESRDAGRGAALRLHLPAHAARPLFAAGPRAPAELGRRLGRGRRRPQPAARPHRSEPPLLFDRHHLGGRSRCPVHRAGEVARPGGTTPHRAGRKHRAGPHRQCHRAAAPLGRPAAARVAGGPRDLYDPAAARERSVHRHDPTSRGVGHGAATRPHAAA